MPHDESSRDLRLTAACGWLPKTPASGYQELIPVAGDASFRRYFRVVTDGGCWILMDAPPDKEGTAAFIHINGLLRGAGLHAPEIIARDEDNGFLLLEDLGDELYRGLVNETSVESIFKEAFRALATMATDVGTDGIPDYDRNRLSEELELFPHWWLGRHHDIDLSCSQHDIWEDLCTRLLRSAAEQPQVFVHRDFHSCNLLRTESNSPGIIDFQDAVRGPLSYDLVSLLWDRYISWPRARMEGWIDTFRQQLGIKVAAADWLRYCDWMSLQRNLKVVGIFARLHYRDGKDGYLEMIPRFWSYVTDVSERYPEFSGFRELLEDLKCAP
jgi:aminoglycoside/choline kinase family phosphotransferase